MSRVKKTTVEKYTIRDERGQWQAHIMVDDQSGDISIQSDYGNYAYWWTARGIGVTLKQFLLSTNDSYVMQKFGYGGKNEHFFDDKTIDNIRAEIAEKYKQGSIDKVEALTCTLELDDIEGNDHKTSTELYSTLVDQAPTLMEKIYDNNPYDIPWVSGTHPSLVAFMERVWPVFIAELKKEALE